ncbi:MAG: glycosyltransferase [Streptococcaceae bacterium]|jgi:hypothetical protein|nr:glycosyltransferase [Streptococcaceae bacterium]
MIEIPVSKIRNKEFLELLTKWLPSLKYVYIPETLSVKEWNDKMGDISNFNKNKITAVIMVKNQEIRIINAIESIIDKVDKVLVFDTGSSDSTIKNVKNINSKKIFLYQREWTEDFSIMRNDTIAHIDEGWVFVIDSDEEFKSEVDYEELHLLIDLVDFLFHHDIVLQVEAHYSSTSRFVLPDRIFKKSKTVKYYGKVHEELISENLFKLKSNFIFENNGILSSEIIKFDKEKRYSDSMIVMLRTDYKNPRWLSLSDKETVELALNSNYEKELKNKILKNTLLPFSELNLQEHEYLRALIEKYISILIQNDNIVEALKVIKISRTKFPKNINFLFYEYFIKQARIRKQLKDSFSEFLLECQLIPEDYKQESQKDDQILMALALIYSKMLGKNYEKYEKYIDDPMIKDFILKGKLMEVSL